MKKNITLVLPNTLVERIRNIVYWSPGLTINQLCLDAIEKSINEMENTYGKPYPQRAKELISGRKLI